MQSDPAMAVADGLHRAGRLAEAAAAYRAVAAARPGHAPAWHRLGLVALQAGRADEALAPLERAAALAPRDAAVHHDRGHALAALGRYAEAAAAWETAARIAPRLAAAHANRGTALAMLGRAGDAVPAFRAALRADPNHRAAWIGLADCLARTGQPREALATLDRARVRVGADAEMALVRAAALRAVGDEGAALALLDETVRAAPRLAPAWSALGLARLAAGDAAGAAEALARAEALDPGDADIPYNRAAAERERDRYEAALAALGRALERRPGFVAARLHRGFVRLEQGRPVEAEAELDAALAARPDHAAAASARLFALNYRDDRDAATVRAAHRAWGQALQASVPPLPATSFDRDPERRLRVGYLSPDFRTHSVAWFLAPLLAAHDRSRVEVVGYADLAEPDDMTARLRARCDLWRDVHGLEDTALAAQVRADAVDLLVDLAGHTAGNRLGVFARRPAPLQATWLGYPNTTGLTAIDFRITDAVCDPAGQGDGGHGDGGHGDGGHAERLVRLDRPFLCYEPPPFAPAPRGDGPPTFGSFNALAKISPATVAVWAAVLDAVPDARLFLKARGLGDPETADWWRARFAAAGLDPRRLILQGRVAATGGHLAQYGAVDVALDPFPYNGTTTTMEALAMGVPVVTLAGDRHAARVGAAILRPLGLDDLAAADAGGYVAAAAGLVRDAARLHGLRAGLPSRLRASPLCDAADFARAMEAAYRDEWRRRVAENRD
ncbi:tetratricopeptide repeat protein [Stella sp.]|uniref:O-linked N-acetylglucosamine transferase, SPINDLY family protein n=1 Tax=Stella sp. TaxID=2912054 RepID=UPI0035AF556F